MEIRKAKPEDAAMLAELSTQLGYPTSTRQSADRLKLLLKSSEHVVLIAGMSDGSVVGWVHVFIARRMESDPFAEIGGFVVAEERRGSGIGTSLLVAAEKWANDQSIPKLRVRSRSTRHDSHTIFGQLGFKKTKDQFVFDKWIK